MFPFDSLRGRRTKGRERAGSYKFEREARSLGSRRIRHGEARSLGSGRIPTIALRAKI